MSKQLIFVSVAICHVAQDKWYTLQKNKAIVRLQQSQVEVCL